MNDQEQASQLSALFDDALPAAQAELVVRRALREPHLQDTWGRYALIGAAMRGDPLAVSGSLHGDLASRVSALLAAEPELKSEAVPRAAAAPPGDRSAFARGAWSMAIAASVAVVSLVVLRAQAPEGSGAAVQMAGAAAVTPAPRATAAAPTVAAAEPAVVQVAANSPPPSYTTPVDNTPPGQQASAPLVNYVVAHSDVAASAVRFSPLSSVMNASYDLAQGTVEMSEAEIGAHR